MSKIVGKIRDLIVELEAIQCLVEDNDVERAMEELECQSGVVEAIYDLLALQEEDHNPNDEFSWEDEQ